MKEVPIIAREVIRAYMLAYKNETPLDTRRLDEQTVELKLAGIKPEIGHAVVAVEVVDANDVGTHRLLSAASENLLHSFDRRRRE